MKIPGLSLQNKVVLVTGATGGIGEAVARVFAAAGAGVFVHGNHTEKVEALFRELLTEKATAAGKAMDITASGAPQELVEAVISEMGRLDVLVNAAGINRPQKAEDVTESNWDDVMAINLRALFFVSQAAGKEMIKGGGGKIVNISSQSGQVALPLRSAYCSSKGGVDQITRTMALEWAPHGINVNAVAPTFVLTPFTKPMFESEDFKKYVLDSIPLGRLASPEDVAYAALFLSSDLADMITGHILTVDGGWTIK